MDIWQASETSLIKADQSTFSSDVVIISYSLMIELSIGDEKRSLPLRAYVEGFGKSSHI